MKNTLLLFIVSVVLFSPSICFGQTTVSLDPIDDAYLEGGSPLNNVYLKVDNDFRISYLKFDLSAVSGTITSAELSLHMFQDSGNGVLQAFLGTTNNWDENTLSNTNKPAQGAELGSISGTFNGNDIISLNTSLLNQGLVSIILKHSSGSDVWYASSSNTNTALRPKLVINYNLGDTQSPTAPTVNSTAQTDTTVDLSWSGATDNVGVTSYSVFQDNVAIQSNMNGTSYQVTGLNASTAYNFMVRAYDAAGNESPNSNILSLTTNSGNSGGGGSSIWTENNTTASYTGEVAIGRSTVPSGYRLAVDGNIRTREVRVDQDNWPDYVFNRDYDLPSLQEVQKHIQEKGHLPNIPSAQEVEKNGEQLGEMNRLLLQKIEELTLYIIQQNKRIKQLEKSNLKD